jgi:septal ring factor EnvC (AmiA/AmiB activator)
MAELDEHFKRINDKLLQLVKQYQLLQKENDKLKQEIKQLQTNHQAQSVHIEQLLQQAEILKLSKSDMVAEEKKAFEKRLNQYIKEIDRCITLLNE